MATKHAKISFRNKTNDCQHCLYKSERKIPNTEIVVHFCTANLPDKVYQLRGHSISNCKQLKHTV
ncbi:MAG: hypothetical protein FH758_01780 [Firmicutes bacterium]|nr:hypothetical protein [Bacillota bacterium]